MSTEDEVEWGIVIAICVDSLGDVGASPALRPRLVLLFVASLGGDRDLSMDVDRALLLLGGRPCLHLGVRSNRLRPRRTLRR